MERGLARLGIRARVAGGSVLIAILISVVAGIVIDAQLERIVRDSTIAVLDSDAAPYVAALQNEPDDEFDPPGPGQLIAVLDGAGQVQLDTLPTSVRDAVVSLVDGRTAEGSGTVRGDYVIESTPVEVRGETWHVVSARSIDIEADVLEQMRALLIGALAVIVCGVGATAWALTAASLGPVNRLRESAEDLSTETLSAASSHDLLPVGPANDEITRLAVTFNDLIGRLRASADRERQLVSDASHELRTPLAILQTQLELARREASSVEQLTRDIEAAERSAVRLGRLVTSMLALSSIESAPSFEGSGSASCTVLELQREVASAVERARFQARGASISIIHRDAIEESGSESYGLPAEDLGRVIDNLVTNALSALARQGSVDGTITILLERTPQALRLSVADTGPGLTREFEPHAFERFARDDTARAKSEGSGLGLPIVAAIVARARGVITVQNSPGAGLTVSAELPRVASPER